MRFSSTTCQLSRAIWEVIDDASTLHRAFNASGGPHRAAHDLVSRIGNGRRPLTARSRLGQHATPACFAKRDRSTNALRLTDARSLRSYPADRLHRVDDPHGLGSARPVHSDHAHYAARSGRSAWVGGVAAFVAGMGSPVTSIHQLHWRLPRRKQIDLAIAGALVISATGCATRLFQRAVPLAVTGWTTSRHLMYQNPLDLVPPRKQDAEQLASQISI